MQTASTAQSACTLHGGPASTGAPASPQESSPPQSPLEQCPYWHRGRKDGHPVAHVQSIIAGGDVEDGPQPAAVSMQTPASNGVPPSNGVPQPTVTLAVVHSVPATSLPSSVQLHEHTPAVVVQCDEYACPSAHRTVPKLLPGQLVNVPEQTPPAM